MKKFFKGLMLFILTTILFFSISSLLTIFPLKNIIGDNGIKEIITSLDIEQMVQEDDNLKEAVDEIVDPIYDELKDYGIKKEVIVKIIDTKEIKSVIGDIKSNVVNYALTGENQKILTTENIETLIGTAVDDLSENGIYNFSQEEKDKIVSIVSDKANEYQEYIPDTNYIDRGLSEDETKVLEIIRFILSDKLMMYILIAVFVSIVGIILLRLKEAKWIKDCSITILISSIIFSITYFALKFLNNISFKVDYPAVFNILNKVIKVGIGYSLALLIITIIILITYKIFNKKKLTK